jgi:medium-chain acyl-[acyl-carrier-protein] hydrolase
VAEQFRKGGSLPTPWLKYFKRSPQALVQLYCFPYAGGASSTFRSWAQALFPTVEVCAAQLPGRAERIFESPFDRLGPLIDALSAALYPSLNKPFALFGHSMGALVGFELAREIHRLCRLQPVHLFVSGCRAPQIGDSRPGIYDLPESEFLTELYRMNGTPKEAIENPELMQLMIPALRADIAVYQTYRYVPGPRLTCPITALSGLEDERISLNHLEAWRDLTSASFTVQMFHGDHFFLHPSEADVLQCLSTHLKSFSRT